MNYSNAIRRTVPYAARCSTYLRRNKNHLKFVVVFIGINIVHPCIHELIGMPTINPIVRFNVSWN